MPMMHEHKSRIALRALVTLGVFVDARLRFL